MNKAWVLLLCFVSSLILLAGYGKVSAQHYQLRFDHLDINDGLSQNLVHDITQDYRGFMWFATNDGVNRYDGSVFRIYYHSHTDSLSLYSSTATAMLVDSKHNLWVGAGGLNVYDRQRDCFVGIWSIKDFSDEDQNLQILDIEEDHNGDLWVAIEKSGLYHLTNLDTTSQEGREVNRSKLRKSFRIDGPYPFHQADEGEYPYIKKVLSVDQSIWVSHEQGVSCLRAHPTGYFSESDSSSFELLDHGIPGMVFFGDILCGEDGTLWIGSSHGLIKLPDHHQLGFFETYLYPDHSKYRAWWSLPRSMESGPDSSIWIATFNGIEIFNPNEGSYTSIRHDPENDHSLSHNSIIDIYTDRGGVIWIGTSGMGLSKYSSLAKPFVHLLNDDLGLQVFSAYGLVRDSQGVFWIGYNDNELGLFETGPDQHLRLVRPLPYRSVFSLVLDSNGYTWFVSDNKIIAAERDGSARRSYEIFQRDAMVLQEDSIPVLLVDRSNQIWACNSRRLCRLDRAGGIAAEFPMPQHTLGRITDLIQDSDRGFWIGSENGLLHFDPQSKESTYYGSDVQERKQYLPVDFVKCLYLDPLNPDRFLWIGSAGGGLYRLDRVSDSIENLTVKDGLSNNYIYGILSDEQGNLWISTNHGLNKYDIALEQFTTFDVDDGLQSNEFNSRSYFRSQDGKMIFGGINGLTIFHPGDIKPSLYQPPVVLTQLFLSYEPVEISSGKNLLQQSITETQYLSLSYDQNTLAFEFAALDYTQPSQNQYRYQLVGFDKQWIYNGTQNRATYTNIPYGQYTLLVEGSNSDAIFSDQSVSLNIRIASPPWLRWWAFLAYALLLGGVVFMVWRYSRERRKLQLKIQEKQIEARKAKELDAFKSKFFTNISHEFKTPLTLIQGRLDELAESLHRSDLREKVLSAQQNTSQVKKLIDQILDISRLESNKYQLFPGTGDIIAFVRQTVMNMKSMADQRKIDLQIASSDSHCLTDFDRDAMEKILQNLISNAIKFTPEASAVRVAARCVKEKNTDHGHVLISVADEGVGIPEEVQPHIFDRFYQVRHGQEWQNGFGLGLALVKELVDLHEGHIELRSSPGRGSIFTVSLPLSVSTAVAVAEQKSQALQMNEQAGPTAVHSRNPEDRVSVLIVEDHHELRHFIRDILCKEFNVLEASNGREGLAIARQAVPDLIVSDIMMPDMDGYEMASQLINEQSTSHIPILFLTAKDTVEDRIKALQLGADEYLGKPFKAEELLARITNLINKRQKLKSYYAQWFKAHALQEGGVEEHREKIFLKRVSDLIEDHMEDVSFGVELLAGQMGMSPSNLYRKVYALTDQSPKQLIQEAKLNKAGQLLRKGFNVSEVSYKTGFRTPSYFSQVFKKHFKCTPKEYCQRV